MRRLFIVLTLFLVPAAPGRADFMNALSAYDAGAYAVAFTEWRRLAEHGDIEAQVALAGLYEAGLGVARNYRAAAGWYERAAEGGHAIARLNIGDYYDRGIGVARDRAKAWYWLALAADAGNEWARGRQAELARLMTAGERRRAGAMLEDTRRKQ